MMVVKKAKLVKLEIDTGWRERHVLMEKSVLVDDKNKPIPEAMGGKWEYRYKGKKSSKAILAAEVKQFEKSLRIHGASDRDKHLV